MYWLGEHDLLPDVTSADPSGLLAVSAVLGIPRLLDAYRRGIFPWYEEPPVRWWYPPTRALLYPHRLHIGRSLRRAVNNTDYSYSRNRAFAHVVDACSAPRKDAEGTWINAQMREAYNELHRLGYAHSVEVWRGNELVGGLYGVATGSVFFGESMFSRIDYGSRLALIELVRWARSCGCPLIDCQQRTEHLMRMGACEVQAADFTAELRHYASQGQLFLSDCSQE